MDYKRIALVIVSGVLMQANVFGQNLTLNEAIRKAMEKNFSVVTADYNKEIAKNNNSWGEAGRMPTVTTTITQNNTLTDPSADPSSFLEEKYLLNGVNGGINANWVLYNGGRIKLNKERLAKLEEQSDGNARVVIENTLHAVVLGYYNALLQKEKLNVLKGQMSSSRRRFEFSKLGEELGTKSSYDVLQFKTQYLTDSSNVILQELAHDNAKRNLNLLMAEQPNQEFELTDAFSLVPQVYDYSILENQMIASNQNVKNQFMNIELRKLERGMARGNLFPVVSLNTGANRNFSIFTVDGETNSGGNLNYYANFTLNFTLFDGKKIRRSIKNAQLSEYIAETSYNEMELKMGHELSKNFEFYGARFKLFEILKETEKAAKVGYEISQDKFEQGVINSFDLRDTQLVFRNASLNSLQGMYNLIETNIELLRITGGLIGEFASTN